MNITIAAGILCFGDRHQHFTEVIDGCAAVGIADIIVFCNNCSDQYLSAIQAVAKDRPGIAIEETTENLGSAGGYSRIISLFLKNSSAQALLLLDDDAQIIRRNPMTSIEELAKSVQCTSIFRADRKVMRDLLEGLPIKKAYPPPGAVLAFDPIYYTQKFLRRFFSKSQDRDGNPALLEAPYSGLVLPRLVLSTIAPPDSEFFIYADDLDYTRRIVDTFGAIPLTTDFEIKDFDHSWNSGSGSNNFILKLASSNSPMRVYYSIRNRVHLDKRQATRSGWFAHLRYAVNLQIVRLVFLIVLRGQVKSAAFDALKDANVGRLGKRTVTYAI